MLTGPATTRQIDASLSLIRFVTGVIFMAHGYQKFFMMGLDGTAGFFDGQGIPMAGIAAPMIATLELAGGAAFALGFLTRPLGVLLALDMLGAITFVHAKNGFFVPMGIEFVMLLMTAAATLAIAGPGSPALDRILFKRNTVSRE